MLFSSRVPAQCRCGMERNQVQPGAGICQVTTRKVAGKGWVQRRCREGGPGELEGESGRLPVSSREVARIQTLYGAQLVKKHKKGIRLCSARLQSRNTETLLGLEQLASVLPRPSNPNGSAAQE